jgi:hypothetical protein
MEGFLQYGIIVIWNQAAEVVMLFYAASLPAKFWGGFK